MVTCKAALYWNLCYWANQFLRKKNRVEGSFEMLEHLLLAESKCYNLHFINNALPPVSWRWLLVFFSHPWSRSCTVCSDREDKPLAPQTCAGRVTITLEYSSGGKTKDLYSSLWDPLHVGNHESQKQRLPVEAWPQNQMSWRASPAVNEVWSFLISFV